MRLSCCFRVVLISGFFCVLSCNVVAQVLIEDQASGQVGEIVVVALNTPTNQIVQSFTPTLSGIGFVQLQTVIAALDPGSLGLTVVVQLREGGSLGPVIAATTPLFLQNLGTEFTPFFFPDNVPLTANQPYYFEPVVLGGGALDVAIKTPGPYDRGNLFLNGGPANPLSDLWFREGLVVPEPGTGVFVLMGLVLLFGWSRRRNRC